MEKRFDILKVIGRYLTVERKGAAYIALCPFHADTHPSLRINPAKNLYHCFSCGAGGDALRFVMEKEGCDFKQALRICSDTCGVWQGANVRLVETDRTKKVTRPLAPPPMGLELLPYDPGHADLRPVYAAFGVGLAPADPPRAYAFTRGRLVFPIHDREGRPVAFAARYLGDPLPEGCPKYLNSPTSDHYKKEELLYGWHQAVASIRATATVILVEGYKDCLAMHAAGFTHTVALCGVSLSDYHVALIRASALTVCLFLDNDAAGQAASEKIQARLRAVPRLSILSIQLSNTLSLPHKDPDELFRSLGKSRFRSLLSGWMIPGERRQAEDDLVRTCLSWPDTSCLTPAGEEVPYVDCIRQALEYDDLWPEDERNRDDLRACAVPPPSPEISRDEQVRRSRQLRAYFLRYLEIRLADRVRRHGYRLSSLSADSGERTDLLHALQYERDYLRDVSSELNRG